MHKCYDGHGSFWAVVELGTHVHVAIAHLQSKTTVVRHQVAISTRSTHYRYTRRVLCIK